VLAGRNLLICSVRTIWTFFADENMQTRTESKFYYEFLEVIKRYRFQASSFWLRKISIGLFIQFPRNFHELFFKYCQIFLNLQENLDFCRKRRLKNDKNQATFIKKIKIRDSYFILIKGFIHIKKYIINCTNRKKIHILKKKSAENSDLKNILYVHMYVFT
jgi:hypothetical protein